ncbi:MAG: hypothetical protein HQ453_07250 [Actinobacteria bacterium]|nr:hypothetical protein [Actinomycetota bacterium]
MHKWVRLRVRTLTTAFLFALMLLVPLGGNAAADPVTASLSSAQIGSSIITIGDSVMLGARWVMKKNGIAIVDAQKNRQAAAGPALLRKRGTNLPVNVVVHLGTNGTFTADACKAIITAAGPTRRVFFLTLAVPRSWEARNNAVIRKCVAAHPGQAFIIDWHAMAAKHPKWLYSDRIHLRPAGAKGYAWMIEQAVAATDS